MFALLCLISFLAVGGISGVASLKHDDNHDNHRELYNAFNSSHMVLSIIARQQGIMNDTTTPGSALQAGLVQKAFTAYNAYYGRHAQIQEYIDRSTISAAKYMANCVDDVKQWPLDRLSNGNAMLTGTDHAYDVALAALRDSIRLNKRNKEDGLWYWEGYPDWSYLDGMYSLGPFLALDSRTAAAAAQQARRDDPNANITAIISPSDGTDKDPGEGAGKDPVEGSGHGPADGPADAALEDLHLQFRLLWDHCLNSTTGLLVHGYDASRRASWASRTSGASAVVWGRSLGWFMMALVDTLELLGGAGAAGAGAGRESLLDMYQRLAVAVMSFADEETGGWFQVVDMAGHQGNYIESSATAMFSYALLKGARLRYLTPSDLVAAQHAGRAAHFLLASEFVTTEGDGTLGFNGTVAVCSLNSTATYDYYIKQPIAPDSVLGSAAFILASLEVERLSDSPNRPL